MSLTDAGFDYSVLCEFRQRLLDHNAAQQLLDVMLKRFAEQGWLKIRSKQRTDSTHGLDARTRRTDSTHGLDARTRRTDSTHILAAIRHLNQLELVHETLRHALNELALEAPAWLRQRVNADWFDSYSQRTSNYLLPKKDAERIAWAERVGQDGLYLLEQVYAGGHHRSTTPNWHDYLL